MSQRPESGAHAAVTSLMDWTRDRAWAGLWEEVLGAHVIDTLEDNGFESTEQLAAAIGPALYQTQVVAAAFEDFLTHPNEEGETIIDAYLKRRGSKEPPPARRYLEGLRDSVMGLYEVLEAVPGSHLILGDMVRGGDPLRVEEGTASSELVRWDCFGCRIVDVDDHCVLSGASFAFDQNAAAELADDLRGLIAETKRDLLPELDDAPDEIDPEMMDVLVLSRSAPLFTSSWLARILDRNALPRWFEHRQPLGTPGEDGRALFEFMERHYRGWPDQPLPVLGGKSARQALHTTEGRCRVIRLLKQMETFEARRVRKDGGLAYDFGWIWRDLGLAPNLGRLDS